MSIYHFNLQNDDSVLDVEGTDLPDDAAAREHAISVARELMFCGRDGFSGAWARYKMSVVDGDGNEVLSFAMTDFKRV